MLGLKLNHISKRGPKVCHDTVRTKQQTTIVSLQWSFSSNLSSNPFIVTGSNTSINFYTQQGWTLQPWLQTTLKTNTISYSKIFWLIEPACQIISIWVLHLIHFNAKMGFAITGWEYYTEIALRPNSMLSSHMILIVLKMLSGKWTGLEECMSSL